VYLALAREVLPTLADNQVDTAALNPQLGKLALRILRFAPLWGEHGPILLDALQSAMRLHRRGARADLTDLFRAMAGRLFLISAAPRLPERDGPP
jgi:hypothetical protein